MEKFHRKTSVFLLRRTHHTSTPPKIANNFHASRLSNSFCRIIFRFFLYVTRLRQSCTSAERFEKKYFLLLIGTAFTSSVRTSINNFILLEKLWLWKSPSLFSACVSWQSDFETMCHFFDRTGHFWKVSTAQLTRFFPSRLQPKKIRACEGFLNLRFIKFNLHVWILTFQKMQLLQLT